MQGGFFMPGPIELLILGLVCVAPLAVLVVVLLAMRMGKKQSGAPPCAKCGGWTVPGTRFCPHCGSPLEGQPPPSS